MARKRKPLFVQYCADDMLGGTLTLTPEQELAYRRICDMIYSTGGQLIDNPKSLAIATKLGNRWAKVRQELLDLGKIEVRDGMIWHERCAEELEKARVNIAQKSRAGKASREMLNIGAKPLIPLERGATAVATAVPTAAPTNRKPVTRSQNLPTSSSESVSREAAPRPRPVDDDAEARAFGGYLHRLRAGEVAPPQEPPSPPPAAPGPKGPGDGAAIPIDDAVAVIQLFDRLRVEAFGEAQRRPWASPMDRTVASRWLADGASLPLLEDVMRAKLGGQAMRGEQPSRSLQHLDLGVRDALQRAKAPETRQERPVASGGYRGSGPGRPGPQAPGAARSRGRSDTDPATLSRDEEIQAQIRRAVLGEVTA